MNIKTKQLLILLASFGLYLFFILGATLLIFKILGSIFFAVIVFFVVMGQERSKEKKSEQEKMYSFFYKSPLLVLAIQPENQTLNWLNERATKVLGKDGATKHLTEWLALIRKKEVVCWGGNEYEGEFHEDEGLLFLFEKEHTQNLTPEAQQLAMGIISVDNYDDVTDNMSDKDSSILNSYLASAISDWMDKYGIYYRRLNNERYYFYLYYEDLEKVMEKKFEILESVRRETSSNSMPITLSMGISYSAGAIRKIAEQAQNNLDLALVRGGDQVVIKDTHRSSQPRYFGGRTSEQTKRSRVRSRAMGNSLEKLIEEASDIYVMGHRFPDMDALGAAFGIARLVDFYDKQAYVVLNQQEINQDIMKCLALLQELPELSNKIIKPEEALNKVSANSLLIMVDYHRPSMSISQPLYQKFQNVVVIDHHRRGSEYPEKPLLSYIESSASSTAELVTELISYQTNRKKRLLKFEATMLMAGIVVDTKNFTVLTSSRTFDAASFLKNFGADTVTVQSLLKEDMQGYLEKSHLISLAEYLGANIAVVCGEEDVPYDGVTAAKTADTLLVIAGIHASFVVTKRTDGEVVINARSFGKVNVQRIMEDLGGGGHFTNAAMQFKNKSIAEVKTQLLKAIHDYKERNEENL